MLVSDLCDMFGSCYFLFFFFSSRRRHTRLQGDWSSDVCSSDLVKTTKQGVHPSWIVVAAGVSAALHVGKLPPAVPVLQQQLGLSLLQAGFLLSTVQVAGMVLGLVVGLGADRWGLRRSMLAGLLLMAGASALGAQIGRAHV